MPEFKLKGKTYKYERTKSGRPIVEGKPLEEFYQDYLLAEHRRKYGFQLSLFQDPIISKNKAK